MKKGNKITLEDLPPLSEKEKEYWEEHNDEYYHYLYRIDNKLNGKFYYGIHSEKKDNIHKLGEDSYMGSGIDLIKAQKEEGIENFEKTIIKTFSTRDEARLEERSIVNEELVKDPNCYNKIISGGAVGGFNEKLLGTVSVNFKDKNLRKDKFFRITSDEYNKNKDKYITISSEKVIVKRKNDGLYSSVSIEEYRKNKDEYLFISSNKGTYKNIFDSNDIRQLSVDDPLVLSGQFIGIRKGIKQSQKTILKKIGDKNGSYGTMWITNGKENRKINSSDSIPVGWNKGRVFLKKRIIKVKGINKNTLEIKYIEKDQIDCMIWYPYIFYLDGKIITKEIFLNIVNSSNSWKEVAKKLNTYKDIVEKFRLYYDIPSNTIQNKYNSHKQ